MIAELKKYVKENKLLLGREVVMKSLKNGKVSRIFMSSNCPADLKDDVAHYTSLAGVEVVEVALTNEEFGTLAKKPFSISVMGLVKE